jgi:hypothetical protein
MLSYIKKILRPIKDKLVKKVIYNIYKTNYDKNAILFYMIDPFTKGIATSHTNYWEIVEITKILKRYNYNVTIIDRNIRISQFKKIDNVDLFIGNASGGGGARYLDLINFYNPKIKVLYTTGEYAPYRNKKNQYRYDYLFERHGVKLARHRHVEQLPIDDFVNNSDVIFGIGSISALSSYKKDEKNIYQILPSTNSELSFINHKFINKSFLYFGGNGSIHKGLDLCLDIFLKSELTLHICTSKYEKDFWDFYEPKIKNKKNIIFHGFVDIETEKFRNISKECSFGLLPSCSEGIATSISACMRTGLIPVITKDVGYDDIEDYGFLIENIEINSFKNRLEEISTISNIQLEDLSHKSFKKSFDFTQGSFTRTFESALVDVQRRFK